MTPQERQICDLLNEIENQTAKQKAATEFLETVYHLAFLNEGEQIERMENVIYAMYVRAENCRISINNTVHELRELMLPEHTKEREKNIPYHHTELIPEE